MVKEISSSGLSLFYDEYNFSHYINEAKMLKDKYGKSKIAGINISGEEYYNRICELNTIANDIMDKKILTNIFDLIPLKKDRTFQKSRRVYLFDNGISYFEPDRGGEYISGKRIALAIVPYGINTWFEYLDMAEVVDKHRARIAITIVFGIRKIYPLLDKSLKVNDIKSKVTYINQADLEPGAIYKEKSGTEYLFLGGIHIVERLSTKPYHFLTSKDKHIDGCKYLKVNKKVKDLLDDCESLDEFLEKWAKVKLKENYDEMGFSERVHTCLRKFIEKTSYPCHKRWVNVNISGPHATPGLPVKPMFSMNLKDRDTKLISKYDFYVYYDDTE